MSGNVIFRGPVTVEPLTVERTIVGTPLPGTIVHSDSASTTVHFTTATTTQMGSMLYVLSNRREIGQDILTAYEAGALGIGCIPRPGEVYQARMAGATYAANAPLTLGVSGRLTNTLAAGDKVIAIYVDTPGAKSAGDLADVQIVAGRTVPA